MQVLKDDIRCDILNSALEVFSVSGYEKATMQSIATSSGISKSNLYRYFPSKEKIFLAIINEPLSDIRKLTDYLTDKANLSGNSDEIAQRYTDQIFPVIKTYRREILMMIKSDLKHGQIMYREELMNGLLANFLFFDMKKLPQEFIHTLANMLLKGLENILTTCQSDEDMYAQLTALLKYHVWGTLAFTNFR